jgi:hypothetical protein
MNPILIDPPSRRINDLAQPAFRDELIHSGLLREPRVMRLKYGFNLSAALTEGFKQIAAGEDELQSRSDIHSLPSFE